MKTENKITTNQWNTNQLDCNLTEMNSKVNWKNINQNKWEIMKSESLSVIQNQQLDTEIQKLVDDKTIIFRYSVGDVKSPNQWDVYLKTDNERVEYNDLGKLRILMSREGISFSFERSEWYLKVIRILHNSKYDSNNDILVLDEVINESIKSKIPYFIKFINKSTNGNLDVNGEYKIYSSFSKYFNRSLIFGIYNTKSEYKRYRSYMIGKLGLKTLDEFRKLVKSLNYDFRSLNLFSPNELFNMR